MTDLSDLKRQLTPKGREILKKTIKEKGEEWVAEHEDLILAQAKKVGHHTEQTMQFTEAQGEQYQSIIEVLLPPDGTPTSTAKLTKELDGESDDIHDAAKDLIAFGELELVNASQHGRVRLRQPTASMKVQATLSDPREYIWHAYITERDGLGRTRARRLFEEQKVAEEHLKQVANVDALTPVPGIMKVWCASIGSKGYTPEYAVLRRDPIFQQADDPYPESG
jgi:hypothetical protein